MSELRETHSTGCQLAKIQIKDIIKTPRHAPLNIDLTFDKQRCILDGMSDNTKQRAKPLELVHLLNAKSIIRWYREGSDLDEAQLHVLNDCALEHGQILDNVVHMDWFMRALASNLEALDGTP